jgi:hypothetical protein
MTRLSVAMAMLSSLAACSACSTGASPAARPSAVAEEEGHAAIAAELPPDAPRQSPAQTTGPYYEPDDGGYASAILRVDAPNMIYAAMDGAVCEKELAKRNIAFEKSEADRAAAPGVVTPLRLRGPLHGVSVRSGLPPADRAKAALEIFDCRLLLALDDFAAMVAKHDVVEMLHLSAYRSRKNGGCTPRYDGKQHCAALAVDIAHFKKKDGTTLVVDRDFKGRVGTKTCTDAVRRAPRDPVSAELWGFACDAAEHAIFNVILTPNFNKQHKNHFHVEITPDAAWMLIK